MRKFLAAAALVAACIGITSVASAADSTATAAIAGHGKLTKFTYKATTKVGKLTVTKAGAKFKYRVDSGTNCGVSFGQSGDEIRCKSLGKAKYAKKHLRITWHKADNGTRVATLVAVDMTH
jgi:opacity protein-like surface antigen